MRIELFPLYVSLFEFVCMHADTGHLFSALAFEEALICSIYYVDSCLLVASNVSNLCLLVLSLVTVVSLVMFCIVAKWYKKR